MRHRHRKEVALSVKLSSSRAVTTWGNLSSGTAVFCKISVRRSKNCLQVSIASGRLQIFRWSFPSCTIFVTYSNEFPQIFLSLIFRIWVPQVRLFFDLKVLWIAQKVHLGGNRRWLCLFIRFKQILTVERQTCKPDRYHNSRRPPERISEEDMEKYQDLKRELKRIWKSTCKEALGARWMESTNLRKWLQELDAVAREIEFGYRSYSSLEQLTCGHRRISGRCFSQPISVKRSDDRKYVCVRRPENSKDP